MASFRDLITLTVPLILICVQSIGCDRHLHCMVCRRIVEEVELAISKEDDAKTIETGGYRLDGKGNKITKTIVYKRSDSHLDDLFESICEKTMGDYVHGKLKKTGERTVFKMSGSEGMTLLGDVDLIPDPTLKTIRTYCEDIIGEHDLIFLHAFKKQLENPAEYICAEEAKFCVDGPDLEGEKLRAMTMAEMMGQANQQQFDPSQFDMPNMEGEEDTEEEADGRAEL